MRKCILGLWTPCVILLALTTIGWRSVKRIEEQKASVQPIAVQTTKTVNSDSLYNNYISKLYDSAKLSLSGLRIEVFERAVTGFYNLRNSGKLGGDKSVVTIADFDLKSTEKRLWIIDLNKKALVLNTWVAHGQGSGGDKAVNFSNASQSFKSSLGFYVTGEVYNGTHGRSLRLDGMDEGFNTNARKRSIVVHGANYVGPQTISALGRLGRSQGCPAVPQSEVKEVIDNISGGTVLFINSSDEHFNSKYLDETMMSTLKPWEGNENHV
ncbi:MAG: murein L,D-transpeptidase catalytic domain family protein [Candidatus Pedobacter colombiensis]|uniref:Murein L,D-transpeptidase catalytic domain family protein n=1 Tax=Candidatus Pedobacter colombiensis TaxID=3121371 RepID=A0AAJ5WD69_9SPHI|nr:murein L,D-transpeptidase catalytic domain family protein [Pedobacter sp.]WEK21431.1 MAG: murein L,D-transpeptidase catalytic domain family protein [Pedobacter sp.]